MRHRRKYKLFGESRIRRGILVRSLKCLESSKIFGMFMRKLIPGETLLEDGKENIGTDSRNKFKNNGKRMV